MKIHPNLWDLTSAVPQGKSVVLDVHVRKGKRKSLQLSQILPLEFRKRRAINS